jgi:hypothetical protein
LLIVHVLKPHNPLAERCFDCSELADFIAHRF